jgi:cyclophilin family peptidyl-prolyl cis-trans isomerase
LIAIQYPSRITQFMKFLSLCLLLASPLHAELLVTFATTRGNVIVSLHYDKTPQTVANFITLAQGTRSRIDPATGAVIRKPLYAGETFYRVVNDAFTGKFAQTGSGTGNTAGYPGYEIRDEFDPDLKHDPYVIAMTNRGEPHQNGSQIYITGDLAIPQFDGSYVVFGKINDIPSQGVMDSIIAGGSNGTTINTVSFQRTSPAAVAFNEHAQNLPVCSGAPGKLEVKPGVECIYAMNAFPPAGSVFQAYRSLNLQTWGKLGEIYQGTGMNGEANRFILDDAQAPRAFYNISLVTYPDALAPASLANRTLDLGVLTGQIMRFVFDGTGQAGVFTYTGNPTASPAFDLLSYTANPYRAELIINTTEYGGLKFDCALDTENTTKIFGRNVYSTWDGSAFVPQSNGALELSKP